MREKVSNHFMTIRLNFFYAVVYTVVYPKEGARSVPWMPQRPGHESRIVTINRGFHLQVTTPGR